MGQIIGKLTADQRQELQASSARPSESARAVRRARLVPLSVSASGNVLPVPRPCRRPEAAPLGGSARRRLRARSATPSRSFAGATVRTSSPAAASRTTTPADPRPVRPSAFAATEVRLTRTSVRTVPSPMAGAEEDQSPRGVCSGHRICLRAWREKFVYGGSARVGFEVIKPGLRRLWPKLAVSRSVQATTIKGDPKFQPILLQEAGSRLKAFAIEGRKGLR